MDYYVLVVELFFLVDYAVLIIQCLVVFVYIFVGFQMFQGRNIF